MKKFLALITLVLMAASFSWSYTARVSTSRPSASRSSSIRSSSIRSSSLKVTAPKVTAPKVTAPKSSFSTTSSSTETLSVPSSKSSSGGYKVSPVTPKSTDGYSVSPAVPHTSSSHSNNWWSSDYDSGNATLRGNRSTTYHSTTLVPIVIHDSTPTRNVDHWNGVSPTLDTSPAQDGLTGLQIALIVIGILVAAVLVIWFLVWLLS